MRGTGSVAGCRQVVGRFSPARAGNGTSIRALKSMCSVQPRACGERDALTAVITHTGGSAPRVRGTGLLRDCEPRGGRFSPARAGNGSHCWTVKPDGTVQPRACGERKNVRRARGVIGGSAPRVRGTEPDEAKSIVANRFSPARAGNGTSQGGKSGPLAGWTRRRGGRGGESRAKDTSAALTPRRRGGGACWGEFRSDGRFSPARAGNGIPTARPHDR